MSCNGCRTGGLPGPRYIAIDCRPGFTRGDVFYLHIKIFRDLLIFVKAASLNLRQRQEKNMKSIWQKIKLMA